MKSKKRSYKKDLKAVLKEFSSLSLKDFNNVEEFSVVVNYYQRTMENLVKTIVDDKVVSEVLED